MITIKEVLEQYKKELKTGAHCDNKAAAEVAVLLSDILQINARTVDISKENWQNINYAGFAKGTAKLLKAYLRNSVKHFFEIGLQMEIEAERKRLTDLFEGK